MMTGYLTAKDIQNGDKLVTVKDVCMVIETLPGDIEDFQIVCFFHEYENPLLMNKTNLNTLFKICGTTSPEKLTGHVIRLRTETARTAGRTVSYIRITSADGEITEHATMNGYLLN